MVYYLITAIAIVLISLGFYFKPKRKKRPRTLIGILNTSSKNKIFKIFKVNPASKKAIQTQKLLIEAGFNIEYETFQRIRYVFPVFVFILLIFFKYTNLLNLALNMEKLKEAAEILENGKIAELNFGINWSLFLIISVLSYFLPMVLLKILAAYRQTKGEKEVLMLQTYAIIMLKANKSVKNILISLMERATVFKPQIQRALSSYSADPNGTLKFLKEEVNHRGFEKIIIALEQSLNKDNEISLKYLNNHRRLGKELQKIKMEESNTKKDVIGILLMIFPLLSFLAVGAYPWFIYVIRLLTKVNF